MFVEASNCGVGCGIDVFSYGDTDSGEGGSGEEVVSGCR